MVVQVEACQVLNTCGGSFPPFSPPSLPPFHLLKSFVSLCVRSLLALQLRRHRHAASRHLNLTVVRQLHAVELRLLLKGDDRFRGKEQITTVRLRSLFRCPFALADDARAAIALQ